VRLNCRQCKKILKEIPYNIKIIETGCGTGQLSNFFSAITNNEIIATDLCEKSIQMAKEFNEKYIKSKKIQFIRSDIFANEITKSSADLVFALGWMHHSMDCKEAFKQVLSLTKRDGYVIISLYNKIGRFKTSIIYMLSKIFGIRIINFLDPALEKIKTNLKKKTWIKDQYFNIWETRHSYDDVINWCKEFNVEILNFYPNYSLNFEDLVLFKKYKRLNFFERILSQLKIFFTSKDGGLFFCIIKK
jgi:SAM-dependent methyltransferase